LSRQPAPDIVKAKAGVSVNVTSVKQGDIAAQVAPVRLAGLSCRVHGLYMLAAVTAAQSQQLLDKTVFCAADAANMSAVQPSRKVAALMTVQDTHGSQ
jgi:hypothetical protein